jgi:hypothetical protein
MKKRIWFPIVASFLTGLLTTFILNSGFYFNERDICSHSTSLLSEVIWIDSLNCYLDSQTKLAELIFYSLFWLALFSIFTFAIARICDGVREKISAD